MTRHLTKPASALAAGVLILSLPAMLRADQTALTPVLDITTGLAGQQAKITWPAEPGVRYRVEKSSSLSPDGGGAWSPRALVESAGANGQWLDPESSGNRAFYRVPEPEPEVFSVFPAVLGPAGGTLTLEAQCLPAGSLLVFELEGLPPVSVPLEPDGPGQYRGLLPVGGMVPGANILSSAVRAPGGQMIAGIGQNFEVTGTGMASDSPPVLPPAAASIKQGHYAVSNFHIEVDGVSGGYLSARAAVLKTKTKSNQSNDRVAGGEPDDCDDRDEDFQASLLMPALMKAKEKANRTKCGNNLRMAGSGDCDDGDAAAVAIPAFMKNARKAKTSEAEVNLGAIARRRGLPGEVTRQECDISLATPAGPSLEWVRTYRSKGHGGGGGGGWTHCYDIRIEPIPPAAGTNAARLYLYGGDGRRDVLFRQADGTYRCDGMFREGHFNADTSFVLTFADKSQFIFCPLVGAPWQGRIGRVQDSNGVGLDVTYNASSQLHTLTSQFGQSFTCAYGPAGQLTSVTDHTGRFVSYDYYAEGEPGGSPGDLKSVSCPQMPGQPPVAGPTVFTYSTGHPDERLNHNLLTVTDGAGRLAAAWTYSTTTDPLAIDFDTCATEDLHRTDPLVGHFATIKIEIGAAGYKLLINDELGRVTECDFDVMHRCVAVREYTGFATPGVPVTSTTNRPAGKLRASDPDFYQTTFRYNADHCVTRVVHPDDTQERFVYGRDLRRDCPVRERGNAHILTLRAPGGEERSVTCDYLPGFGTPEPAAMQATKSTRSRSNIQNNRLAATGGSSAGSGQDPMLASNPIPGVGIVVKRAGMPDKGGKREFPGGSVWDGGDGNRGCTDDDMLPGRAGGQVMGAKAKAWMVNNFEVHPVFGLKTEWITSIGLPKITPKIAKESHGRMAQGSSGCPTRLITSHGQSFTWDYDTRGNCTACRTPIPGAGCDATYNTLGQCTSVTVLNGPGSSFRDECHYDAASAFLSSVVCDANPDGTGLEITTSCVRDSLGRVISLTDPLGNSWLVDYNALDDVIRTQTPVTGTDAATASRIATGYIYDAGGLLARCDVEHRDSAGVLDAVNPAYSTFFVYDRRARLVRVAEEERPVDAPATPPALDPEPLGIANFAVCDFMYDDAGQCVRVSTPAACRAQSTDAVCDYQYDERGLNFRCIEGGLGSPSAIIHQCDYDSFGALARWTQLPVPGGLPGHDPLNVTFTYDGFHRLASCTDPMGNVESFEYDEQGFVTLSVHGEVEDQPGSSQNVLLAKGRRRYNYFEAWPCRWKGPETGGFHGCLCGNTDHFRAACFSVFAIDDVCTWERFTPGAPAPHSTETTTVHRSPAGLIQSVTRNGDTLLAYTYDSAGRVITCSDGYTVRVTVRDSFGNALVSSRTDHSSVAGTPGKTFTVSFTYDALNRRVTCADNGGNNENWDFDSLGRCVQYSPPTGVALRCRYDGESAGSAGTMEPYSLLLEADVDGDGKAEMLRQALCRSGECRSVTNSNGYTTSFTRDALGRCVQCDHPDGTHESWGADAYGRINSHAHRDGTVVIADLDRDGRPDLVSWNGTPGALPAPPADCKWDGLGRLVQCDQGDSHLSFAWDSIGNQTSETHNNLIITRTFNHRGRTGITYPDGARFLEDRNTRGLPTAVHAATAAGIPILPPITQIDYLGHRSSRETRANGVVTTLEYRSDGDPPLPGGGEDFSFDACVRVQCTGADDAVISSTAFRRSRNQCLTGCDTQFSDAPAAAGRRQMFTRDRLDRVIGCVTVRREVTGGPAVPESDVVYTLDLEGRRLTATGGANPGAYTQNAIVPPGDQQMKRYSSWPGGPLEWDDNGCLTAMSSSTGHLQCVYDSASRLVAVNDPGTGASLATYAYDALGRRTRSTIAGDAVNPPVTTFFVYDGAQCIEELDEFGKPVLTFAAIGAGPCISTKNGTVIYPHGGSGNTGPGAGDAFTYPILPAIMTRLEPIEVEDPVLERRAGHGQLLAGPDGNVLERLDCDDGGHPVFLTSDGLPRAGATDTLTGYRWLSPRCIWCPETRFFQCGGTVYSPLLGQPVSVQKEKPKSKPVSTKGWDLATNKKV